MAAKLPRNVDLALLLVRLSVGVLMLFHGYDKLANGIGGVESMAEGKGLPGAFAYGVYVGEIVAPVFLILGIYTRIAGLLVAFTMLVSIWLAFGGDAFSLDEYGGVTVELNLLYLFGSLALFFSGAGRYSVRKGLPVWD